MVKILKNSLAVIIVLAFAIVVSTGAAIASEEVPGYAPLMEVNDDNLISIAEEFIEMMHIHQQHLEVFSESSDIMELGQKAETLFTGHHTESHVLVLDFSRMLNTILPAEEAEKYNINEELLSMFQNRIGNMLISNLNAQEGVEYVAFSSMLAVSRSFVADLDQEVLVVLEYDGEFSIVADFFPSGEHVMTATGMVIPSVTVPDLLAMTADGE